MCREHGADLTFTEMVSVDGLLYENHATHELLKILPEEKPVGFQFFGSDPVLFEKVIPDIMELEPDVIDINFGCPVQKVVKRGAGAALLRDVEKVFHLMQAVRGATHLPLTAKIRLGWDWNSVVACDAALAAEAGGADAVTVHARTRSQGYSGEAHWEYIAEVKSRLNIPVIGNGDVFDAESARRMFETTGVDGIMLARGTLGRPWLFKEIITYLESGEILPEPSIAEKFEMLKKHYCLEVEWFGEFPALLRMKKHFAWYTRGLPHSAKLRGRIFEAKTMEDVNSIFFNFVEENKNFGERESSRKSG